MIVLTLVLTRCTGSVPTSGILPKVDGSNVSNVSASSVGGVPAASVASATTQVLAATSQSTASTLVTRDASGNFSAGTITATLNGAASYAVGQKGSNVNAAATLSLPSDGNYFDVLNTTPTITGMSARPPGTRVTLYFVDGARLQGGATFLLQGGATSQFTTAAGDVFEFLYTGTKWIELSRMTKNESEVAAYTTIMKPLTGTLMPLYFDGITVNTQGELTGDATSGSAFTANQNGSYQIDFRYTTVGTTSGNLDCVAGISIAGQEMDRCYASVPPNLGCVVQCSGTYRLVAGQAATFTAASSPAVSVNASLPTLSHLRIRRVGN